MADTIGQEPNPDRWKMWPNPAIRDLIDAVLKTVILDDRPEPRVQWYWDHDDQLHFVQRLPARFLPEDKKENAL